MKLLWCLFLLQAWTLVALGPEYRSESTPFSRKMWKADSVLQHDPRGKKRAAVQDRIPVGILPTMTIPYVKKK